MMPSELVKYYSQRGFRDFMLSFSRNREVVPRFRDKFGERPQSFRFEDDLLRVIRSGASSFHFSEERWTNPMTLSPDLNSQSLNDLRSGWDLVFDVDTKVLDYAKVCAKLIIDALDFHDVKDISVKFSGGSGFHIGVAFDKPVKIKGELTKNLFPNAPRIIGSYLQAMIRDYLRDMLLERDKLSVIAERTGINIEEIAPRGVLNPLAVVSIDPVAVSPRHLIRAPYSLNEKKWLVSIPVNPKKILDFNPDEARPDCVSFDRPFLDKLCDATQLFVQAFDWFEKEESKKVRKFDAVVPLKAVMPGMFPPCINNILAGLTDGRKRALFILINFYYKCGYSWPSINDLVLKWNELNKPPLKSGYVKAQVEWASKQGGLMPNNCSNPNYRDINICKPDPLCAKIKNPVTYALHKNKALKPKRKRSERASPVSREDEGLSLKPDENN